MAEQNPQVYRVAAVSQVSLAEEAPERMEASFGLRDFRGLEKVKEVFAEIVVSQLPAPFGAEHKFVIVGVHPAKNMLPAFEGYRHPPLLIPLPRERHHQPVQVDVLPG